VRDGTGAPASPSDELTDAQSDVVRQLGRGPVKVVAAAGSGKTTTMASVYEAAMRSGLGADRIMAVTFTELAAAELKLKILGTVMAAPKVTQEEAVEALQGGWIGTFHKLIRRLLEERSYLAGVPRDLTLIDEVAAAVEMEAALGRLRQQLEGSGSWTKLLPPDPDPRTLLGLFGGAAGAVGRLRSTELEPSDCERSSLAAYRAFAQAEDPPEELAWHRLALRLTADLWQEYERRLAIARVLDFDGLLREGLRALRRSPELLRWCRRNFELVIVDEYQDTSALQEALILEMTGPWQQSLFMVGDARQSIYAFRDAKPGIMAAAQGRRFGLFLNHRSRASILAAADHVIKADPQFAADEAMEAARADESPLPVWVAEVEDPSREAEAIAEALALLHRWGITYPDGTKQGVPWGQMAVLAYTYRRLGPMLEEALRRRGIPFQTATGWLLERPEVKDVVALLRLAGDEADDLACLRLLQCPVVRIPDRALLALIPSTAEREVPLAARLRRHLAAGAPGWTKAWSARAAAVVTVVDELRVESGRVPADELLSTAMRRSGLLRLHQARARGGRTGGQRALTSLAELERISGERRTRSGWLSLSQLLERLTAMREEARTAEPPARNEEDLVTLCTIHRAKGLEWPVVVLADCRPYQARGQGRVLWDRPAGAVISTKIGATDTAAFKRWKEGPEARVDREEHRRLVYVAMTRARDLLVVTTSRSGKNGEFLELAKAAGEGREWVREWPAFAASTGLPWATAGGGGLEPASPGEAVAGPQIPVARLAQRWREIASLERPASSGWARPAHLSFTAIDLMNRCPRRFWYTHLAGYPSLEPAQPGPRSDRSVAPRGLEREQALDLGTAVHRVLEQLHTDVPSRAPAPAEVLAALDRAAVPLGSEQRRLAEEMLATYAASPVAALPTVAVEFPFTWRSWAGPGCPPLHGVIDRVAQLESGALLVVDYKTNATVSPEELGEYSRQLRLYAAAVAAGALGTPVRVPGAALATLRSGRLLEVSTAPEELGEALQWAGAAAARVKAGDYRSVERFPSRPCGDCPFLDRCPERREGLATPSRGA
jgi:superfamily I DNA/RNA helicase/RecB family exonuclease